MMKIFAFLIVCFVAFSTVAAQLYPYTAQPTLYHTFDTAPSTATLTSAGSNFTWFSGISSHSGLAYFDGVGVTLANHLPHFIDLIQLRDNYGNVLSSVIGGEMTFEFWVSFGALNNNAHLMDIGLLTAQNIFISNAARTNEFQFFVNGNWLYANYAIHPNTWQHIVVSVSQNSISDSTSATAANYTFYCNGILCPVQGSGTGFKNPIPNPLPSYTSRSNAYISKSAWAATTPTGSGDSYFQGWVDSFAYYNYGLSMEQIQVHYLVPRLPVYELTFSKDPSVVIGTTPTYSWAVQDSSDGSLSQYHQGLLALSSSQLVNMSANSSSTSVGAAIPIIGGTGSGTGSSGNSLTTGWTFEVIVKFSSIVASSTVFDLSTDTGSNSIGIGFTSGSVLQFYSTNNRLSSTATLQIASSVTANQWYHISVVLASPNSITAYVNGNVTYSTTSTAFPDAIQRGNSLLGKSYNSNVYANLKLDAFRIYDVALSAATVYGLAQLTVAPLPTPSQPLPTITAATTGPINAYTFDVSPATFLELENENSYFMWTQSLSTHYGLAYFDGVSNVNEEYVNLRDYPDSFGNVLPGVIGGSLSFEMWVMPTAASANQHFVDLAGVTEYYDNNIFMGIYASGSTYFFQWYVIYGKQSDPLGNFNNQLLSTSSIQFNQWYHLVGTVKQIAKNDSTSSTAAQMCIYVNGVQDSACMLSYLPQYVDRPNSFIAKSNWDSDPRYAGYVDSFMYYNYALSADQVLAHSKLGRPPILDNSFSTDPRNASLSYTYSWRSSDPSDSGSAHQGLIVLNSANANSVNLAAANGPNSVGTVFPVIGGAATAHSDAPGSGVSVGWTIEILFKPTSFTPGGAIFDFGNTGTQDEITLQFATSTTSALQYLTYNSAYPSATPVPMVNATVMTQWYHAFIVYTPSASSTMGTQTVYVNGALKSLVSAAYPQATSRVNALLGKSINGLYTSVVIDSVRVYDYAVSPSTVTALWTIVASSSPTIQQPPVAISSSGANDGGGDGLSSGAIAGIIIGVVIGVLIVCCILFFLLCMGQRQKKSSSSDFDSAQPHTQMDKSDSEDIEMTS